MKALFLTAGLIAAGSIAGACAPMEPLVAEPVMSDAECREEVRRSPEVRRILREWNPENPANTRRVQTEQHELEGRLYAECLRRRGQPVSGGVEPIRRINQ